jgi:hypothetical protein
MGDLIMEFNIINGLVIKCRNCGESHIVNLDDLNLELLETYQREMGPEKSYIADFDIVCNCKIRISGKIELWEYPENSINHYNVLYNS